MNYLEREFGHRAVGGNDQLRLRVTWSLSQFVVAAASKGEAAGLGDLDQPAPSARLRALWRLAARGLGRQPHGHYLDNDQNRPKSAECQHCAPNENYARELMQLFSVGVLKLNADGTPQRDAAGGFVETYTQRDVEELARVLTGWSTSYAPRETADGTGATGASRWCRAPGRRSATRARKVVMGKVFPAGQSPTKDLDDAIALLMAHQNIAPFVGLRLIQHLVKSDPSPAYVARVAGHVPQQRPGRGGRHEGRDQGGAARRRGATRRRPGGASAARRQVPRAVPAQHGHLARPGLHQRCRAPTGAAWASRSTQQPFRQSSVFSFYAPTDRAPGSNLLAPEQRLLTAEDIRNRLSLLGATQLTWDNQTQDPQLPRSRGRGLQRRAVACRLRELAARLQRPAVGALLPRRDATHAAQQHRADHARTLAALEQATTLSKAPCA